MKQKRLQDAPIDIPEEADSDDIYDSLLRDLTSRDLARREGRREGRTVVVEPRPGDESVVIGRRDDLDRFQEFFKRGKARVREVEVARFPSAPEEIEKVRKMVIPRLSKARARLGLPRLPILSDIAEGVLEAAEDKIVSALPETSVTEPGD